MVKKLYEEMIYRLMAGVMRLPGRLSLSQCRWCGKVCGRIGYHVARRRRRIAWENTGIVFPDMRDSEREKLVRSVFENLWQVVFEILWSNGMSAEELSHYIEIEGRENAEIAHAQGKGILALAGHFGSWEVMSVMPALLGYQTSIIYRPLDFPPLERLVAQLRTRFGARQIPRKKALRKILGALEEKNVIAIMLDQHITPRKGILMDFCGRIASTSNGLALLAIKTGAPVVPLFFLRTKDGFKARILPQVPLVDTGDREADVRANTEQYNRCLEDMIRSYPEQWFWLHRRWRDKY